MEHPYGSVVSALRVVEVGLPGELGNAEQFVVEFLQFCFQVLQCFQSLFLVAVAELLIIHQPLRDIFSIHYRLSAVLDLTDTSNQQALATNLQELTGAWIPFSAENQISPTQEVGAAAHNLMKIEALKVPSAQNIQAPCAYNLAVFPDRLLLNSYIEIYDDSGTGASSGWGSTKLVRGIRQRTNYQTFG